MRTRQAARLEKSKKKPENKPLDNIDWSKVVKLKDQTIKNDLLLLSFIPRKPKKGMHYDLVVEKKIESKPLVKEKPKVPIKSAVVKNEVTPEMEAAARETLVKIAKRYREEGKLKFNSIELNKVNHPKQKTQQEKSEPVHIPPEEKSSVSDFEEPDPIPPRVLQEMRSEMLAEEVKRRIGEARSEEMRGLGPEDFEYPSRPR